MVYWRQPNNGRNTDKRRDSESAPDSIIRDFPDHTTFREKDVTLACADNLGVFLSLTLCNKASFDPL